MLRKSHPKSLVGDDIVGAAIRHHRGSFSGSVVMPLIPSPPGRSRRGQGPAEITRVGARVSHPPTSRAAVLHHEGVTVAPVHPTFPSRLGELDTPCRAGAESMCPRLVEVAPVTSRRGLGCR
jgi:hypothetical protein